MPKAPLLTEEEIGAGLAPLAGWQRRDQAIEKAFRFRDFREAVDFVVRIADPADEQNHHPDVSIHWNQVSLRLWTHASGGITERDLRLARTIDQIMED